MNLKAIENSLTEISKELEGVEQRREKILKESRDIVSFSAKAIIDLHAGRINEAKERLRSASTLLAQLRKVASHDLYRYLLQPEAEFVEASTFYAVASTGRLPHYRRLGVRGAAYLLGLLDLIGEIKRMVYDTIRIGRSSQAESLFTLMERIYTHVYPYAIYDHVAPGLRRKLDVARILIEDTRSTVTEEARRTTFMKAVRELSRKLPATSGKKGSQP